MFTKNQLEEWRQKGFLFDRFYDRVAVESPNRNGSDALASTKILGYMWCDGTGQSFTRGTLPFGQTDLAAIFTFSEKALGKICRIKIVNINNGVVVIKNRFSVDSLRLKVAFDLDKLFSACTTSISRFEIEITVDDQRYKRAGDEELIRNQEILDIHYVILVPLIMKSRRWNIAIKSQQEWFENKANNFPWEADPELNYYGFSDWAMKFERFKENYERNKDKWKAAESIVQLRKEILKMVNDGYAKMPSEQDPTTSFGPSLNDGKLVEHEIFPEELNMRSIKIRIPLFDKYHFSSFEYKESKLFAELDDLYAAVANCRVRFNAKGTLQYVNSQKVLVTITDLGVYIRDGFDFVGNQSLGSWSYQNNQISPTIFVPRGSIQISNKNYRDYRNATGRGRDFYSYSTIMINHPNFTFQL